MNILEHHQNRLPRGQAFELRELRLKNPLLALLRAEVERRVAVASWDRQQACHQRHDLPKIAGRLGEHRLEL